MKRTATATYLPGRLTRDTHIWFPNRGGALPKPTAQTVSRQAPMTLQTQSQLAGGLTKEHGRKNARQNWGQDAPAKQQLRVNPCMDARDTLSTKHSRRPEAQYSLHTTGLHGYRGHAYVVVTYKNTLSAVQRTHSHTQLNSSASTPCNIACRAHMQQWPYANATCLLRKC